MITFIYNLKSNVNKMLCYVIVVTLCLSKLGNAADYLVHLKSNSPVVRGGTVEFFAELTHDDGTKASGDFRYDWQDNTEQSNTRSHKSNATTDTWNVTYPQDKYRAQSYEIQVTVYHYLVWIYFPVASQRLKFQLTENLNGAMELKQDKTQPTKDFISNAETVHHDISLSKADAEFLEKNATSVLTYWFIDCIYYGMTTRDFKFDYNYTDAEVEHTIEALVVAGYEPITTTTAPTTTTTPQTTTTPKTTTTQTTTKPTSTPPPTTKTNAIEKQARVAKRDVNMQPKLSPRLWMMKNGKKVPYDGPDLPLVCSANASTDILRDSSKTYGYFTRQVTVKAPVHNLTVTGNNWIQHSDLLDLHVSCSGSKPYYYCVDYKREASNATNATCSSVTPRDTCDFSIEHYYSEAKEYTVVIVVWNDISKVVNPVTVTVYKATRHAQLSVIVVPVSCCLVAVVLIVFGIAYYMQNRSRFIVEVADFNFAQQYQDLEYKTFRERLRDSVSNAFIRDSNLRETSSGGGNPEGGNPWAERKYGSMT